MNAKRLHSISISALVLILSAGSAFAQNVGPVFQGNPFSWSRNVCGSGIFPGASWERDFRASSASLYGTLEQGDFRPGYSSSSIWRMGAEAWTAGHFNGGKTFLTGSFSFEEMHGKDMMTSVFINPGYYPIDVLEFTPGDKKLQTYRFSGGLGQQIAPNWRIGGLVDFTSQNYSKRKDIRHTNYGLDITIAPSVLWRAPFGLLGLSGIFRKTAESIEAEQVGAATADTYMAFFDKGLRYGTLQAWDGAGIHLAEAGVNRLPVREFSWGAALQYNTPSTAVDNFYVDAEYLRTRGSVGEKGYDWYRFPGHKIAANASWNHYWADLRAGTLLDLHFGWRGQRLEESALDKVTSGGVTLPTVYGWNLVSRRRQTDIAPTLTISFPYAVHSRPPMLRSLTLGYVAVLMDEQASPSWPYSARWHAALHRLRGNAAFGIPAAGVWERFTLHLGGRYLWANDREEGLSAGADAATVVPAAPPTRLTSDWDRKHEYMTASAVEINGGLVYAIAAVPGLSLRADAAWLHAFKIEYLLGKNRLTATLRLRYAF